MARNDVLVNAEWVEQNLDADNVVFVEVDEDTSAARQWGHIPGAVKLDWKKGPGTRSADFVNAEQFGARSCPERHWQRQHRHPLRRQQTGSPRTRTGTSKLYGHQDVKLLDGGRKVGALTVAR